MKSLDEKHNVGTIQKHWSGFGREIFTDSDQFGVQFPQDLDVKIKAVLLGACLLIVSILSTRDLQPSAHQIIFQSLESTDHFPTISNIVISVFFSRTSCTSSNTILWASNAKSVVAETHFEVTRYTDTDIERYCI